MQNHRLWFTFQFNFIYVVSFLFVLLGTTIYSLRDTHTAGESADNGDNLLQLQTHKLESKSDESIGSGGKYGTYDELQQEKSNFDSEQSEFLNSKNGRMKNV